MIHEEIARLAERISNGEATADDIERYNQLLDQVSEDADWDELLLGDKQATAQLLQQRIRENTGAAKGRLLRMVAKAASAAAVIACCWFFGKKLWKQYNGNAPTELALKEQAPQPGGNKAVLTLASGQQIVLDSAGHGTLQQGGATIQLGNGQVAYHPGDQPPAAAMNMLSTPPGGQYQLLLPDGSKVWLNAASSIRFPSGFSGSERKVEITGEAYFEVAANARQPFVVSAGDKTVQVLGTRFNFMAYPEEPGANVTLLEGAVRVGYQADTTTLKPGQQARLKADHTLEVATCKDIQQAVAWKEGYFAMNGEGTAAMMRQLARWYNVEVTYKNKIPELRFEGSIKRSYSLQEVLSILEESGIHFTVEGRKIIVI
ncbi:FecR family protein [Chitinophaga vietnamensis]|uniref:FecR family protein n=1 Tax=Chitinophaga vietnamensis TaxID=2593957 RepID=UPI00117744B4|nr:FecR family protein [Chitinophaga vietnamensis]